MPQVTNHTRTEKISGDSIFMSMVIQVERKTVMTGSLNHKRNEKRKVKLKTRQGRLDYKWDT